MCEGEPRRRIGQTGSALAKFLRGGFGREVWHPIGCVGRGLGDHLGASRSEASFMCFLEGWRDRFILLEKTDLGGN